MADHKTQWRLFFVLLLISFLQIIHVHGHEHPQVPCYFIFGDSLADNGNNNNRHTYAKANYPPYGVGFHEGRPTGRFTNDRTIFDVITQLVGFDHFIPAFSNAKGEDFLRGVNYASAASGILDQTGRLNQGDVISLNRQLSNHLRTISNIRRLKRNNTRATSEYLSKCLYTVEMGSSDYINNYFQRDTYNTSSVFTQEQFADVLIKQYTKQLKTLHSYGARKVAVFGLNFIGTAPAITLRLGVAGALMGTVASQKFNEKLPGLINELNNQLPGAKITFINTGGITVTSPSIAALNSVGTCCKVVDVYYTCARDRPPCPDPNRFSFFDGYHPTDAVNVIVAARVYSKKLPTDCSPYDISTLTKL